jgi:alpha-glucosidase (family GH31 glycosyl hydrolase)
MGNFSNYARDVHSVVVRSDSAAVRLSFYSHEIVRFDYLPSPQALIDTSFVVLQAPRDNAQFTIRDSDSALTILSTRLAVRFHKHPLRISIQDSLGRVLLSEPRSGGLSVHGQSRALRFSMHTDDHFYGTGERGIALDKRGHKFLSYNTQVGGYSEPLATMNINVPLVTATNGYALYIDNTYSGTFDFGTSDSSLFSYEAEGGELSFYVIVVSTIPEQLERYTWLTGRQPLPPRWAFGFIQSKNRYENESEARTVVRTMREKNIPCDGIVLDLRWFANMGDVSWNESSWPNHTAMVSDFLSQGMKTLLITEPYIIQPSRNFIEADTNGFLAKDSTGHTFLMPKWWSCGYECSSSLLDITNPEARTWWWSKHPASFGSQVAGIWTDLGEPERHPEGMIHMLGSAAKIHNIYNLFWAKTIFDGFSALRPAERVMNITRSGFAGIQRYGVLPWSGDVARSFAGLQVQLPLLLGMGMSGIAYQHSDIGGYSRIPTTPELYIRWMQFGTFSPIARAHGAGEVVNGFATEPWQFGHEAETICREFIRLRYQLLPYTYTLAHRNSESGMPLARPLFWLDPSDSKLFNESSSYMWGDAFLVSPVVSAGQQTKEVYLPRGTWIDFWTDETVQGGKNITAAAPLERMPVFVKEGSIIPMAPVMDYSDERPLDTLRIHVYASKSKKVTYMLYEDDGRTREYQSGKYSLTTFTQRTSVDNGAATMFLTAGKSRGGFGGQLTEREYIFEIHQISRKPVRVRCNGIAAYEAKNFDSMTSSARQIYHDAKAKILHVRVHSRLNVSTTLEITLARGNE